MDDPDKIINKLHPIMRHYICMLIELQESTAVSIPVIGGIARPIPSACRGSRLAETCRFFDKLHVVAHVIGARAMRPYNLFV